MPAPRRSLLATAVLLPAVPVRRPAAAQQRFVSIFMFVAAGPGGGWDGSGRAIEQAARPVGPVGSVQF
jgi:putative tricarboxylic transport membrane protein